MSDTTSVSPFSAPLAGELIVVDRDPRRELAHRAIAGYLAGYSGATLVAYRLDLRQWVTWLDTNGVEILDVQRAHIELDARWSEETRSRPLDDRAAAANDLRVLPVLLTRSRDR